MSRRNARKNAFFLVFQMDFNHETEFEEAKEVFFAEIEEPIDEADKAFILQEVDGVKVHLGEIDEKIGQKAKKWSMNRLSKVDLAILRLAIYEICFSEETPVGVAINEAVELAKKFSSEEAPGFINGILGNIAAEQTN